MQALVVVAQRELSNLLVKALNNIDVEAIQIADLATAATVYESCRPALVIASWRLDSLDGLAFCRQLSAAHRQHSPGMLIVTDRSSAADLQSVLDAGADDLIFYPADSDRLQFRLQIAVQHARNRAAAAEAEQRLSERVERFELAVRGADEGLWDAEPAGKPWDTPDAEIWYSPRCKQLLGFADDEFPNVLKSWEARLHPDDRERVFLALKNHIEQRQPYDIEYRLQIKSSEYRWFAARGQGIWDEQDRLMRMSGSLRDITQLKEDKTKLEDSEAKWRSLVENAPNIIMLAGLDGTIRFINRKTPLAIESIGRTTYDYIDEPSRLAMGEAFHALLTTGEPQRYEVKGQTETGVGLLWYDNRMAPIWRDGRIESAVVIATDITDRKIVEQQLHRERQLLRRLLDLQERERQLVAYEIHDGLGQYLTGGLMHLEASMASGKTRKEKTQADHERGMSLLRDALAEARRLISGLRPPILDEQGVAVALEYLINESRAEILHIEFVNHSYFGRLAAPLEVAIFRITQEALSNIRHHSQSRRARVQLLQHGQWVRLVVRDWGCGFDTAQIQEVRFGLQGIRQRARLLGTIATIESAPGKGTMIVVDFPLIQRDPELDAASLTNQMATA
jgi:PAS domain S-box-containing protein